MNLRKLLGVAVFAFAVFYAITNPADAAGFVVDIASGIGAFASALADGL
ncbi:hypothetical protein [Paractinoplanes rishiriensis]|uniref:Uncharacterized protein n=1 Tax=Paractinoplanes rishiriensis TaxID=1050105 RepID=A0A919MWC7_9ACTN|nr:hypothetical protein [Actinoplanes rishiriensis]GIF02352.1 hypothetical protein Ari01nite_98160 [Actinoplanes rishiriensis]